MSAPSWPASERERLLVNAKNAVAAEANKRAKTQPVRDTLNEGYQKYITIGRKVIERGAGDDSPGDRDVDPRITVIQHKGASKLLEANTVLRLDKNSQNAYVEFQHPARANYALRIYGADLGFRAAGNAERCLDWILYNDPHDPMLARTRQDLQLERGTDVPQFIVDAFMKETDMVLELELFLDKSQAKPVITGYSGDITQDLEQQGDDFLNVSQAICAEKGRVKLFALIRGRDSFVRRVIGSMAYLEAALALSAKFGMNWYYRGQNAGYEDDSTSRMNNWVNMNKPEGKPGLIEFPKWLVTQWLEGQDGYRRVSATGSFKEETIFRDMAQ